MSIQAAQAFLQRLMVDETLQAHLSEAGEIDALAAVGASFGFDFTAEEYLEATLLGWDVGEFEGRDMD
jgi:predicted ribosomally synthesized peptide with nif11-like leader